MIGKIILATIILVLLFIGYKVMRTCQTGDASGMLGKMFAAPCHLLFTA